MSEKEFYEAERVIFPQTPEIGKDFYIGEVCFVYQQPTTGEEEFGGVVGKWVCAEHDFEIVMQKSKHGDRWSVRHHSLDAEPIAYAETSSQEAVVQFLSQIPRLFPDAK